MGYAPLRRTTWVFLGVVGHGGSSHPHDVHATSVLLNTAATLNATRESHDRHDRGSTTTVDVLPLLESGFVQLLEASFFAAHRLNCHDALVFSITTALRLEPLLQDTIPTRPPSWPNVPLALSSSSSYVPEYDRSLLTATALLRAGRYEKSLVRAFPPPLRQTMGALWSLWTTVSVIVTAASEERRMPPSSRTSSHSPLTTTTTRSVEMVMALLSQFNTTAVALFNTSFFSQELELSVATLPVLLRAHYALDVVQPSGPSLPTYFLHEEEEEVATSLLSRDDSFHDPARVLKNDKGRHLLREEDGPNLSSRVKSKRNVTQLNALVARDAEAHAQEIQQRRARFPTTVRSGRELASRSDLVVSAS